MFFMLLIYALFAIKFLIKGQKVEKKTIKY